MLQELLEKKPLMCRVLMEKVEDYFQDEEHEKAFEAWYEKKYGKPYEQQKTRK